MNSASFLYFKGMALISVYAVRLKIYLNPDHHGVLKNCKVPNLDNVQIRPEISTPKGMYQPLNENL